MGRGEGEEFEDGCDSYDRPSKWLGALRASSSVQWETLLDIIPGFCDDAGELLGEAFGFVWGSGRSTAASRDRTALSDLERVLGSVDIKPRERLNQASTKGKVDKR